MIFSEAMYVSEIAAPPGFMIGPNLCSMEINEYEDALMAAK